MTNRIMILPMCAKTWSQETEGPRESALMAFVRDGNELDIADAYVLVEPPGNPWFDMTALLDLVEQAGCVPVPIYLLNVTATTITVRICDGFDLDIARRTLIPVDPVHGIEVCTVTKAEVADRAAAS